jgi:hypothetical protein
MPPADVVKRWATELKSTLSTWLGWQAQMIAEFNTRLTVDLAKRIQTRRSMEPQRLELEAALPFALRRRADAPLTYTPEGYKKKRIVPVAANSQSFAPEPALNDEQFAEILDVLRSVGRTMERTPKAFEKMDEEALRTMLMTGLNASFEGGATSETFNYTGKSDILIRDSDRNLLVGECKIWTGAAAFSGGDGARGVVDQILVYMTWRDARAVIILFVRNRDMSAVVQQIPALVRAHPNFRRELPRPDESEFACEIAQRDDPQRELTLVVTAFHLPKAG